MHRKQRKLTTCLAAATAVAVAAVLVAVSAPLASAATHTVTVVPGEDLYSPQNLGNINPADIVSWKNNSTHDIRSARIPAGATAFTSPIQSGAVTYSQTVTAPGNYRYYCALHSDVAAANAPTQSTNEMVGQFTVAAATPVPTVPPTVEPTVPPTVEPTVPPTVEPTVPPTVEPTVPPTVEPTVPPTVEPTVPPTVPPTVEPTVPPTVEPTVPPTEPTVPPTVEPTVPPTEPTVPPAEPTVPPADPPVPPADPTDVPSFKVDVESDHGAIEIEAEVGSNNRHGRHKADRGATFTASAVAHFTTGDVTVQLRRDGKSEVEGKIRVPRRQRAGGVTVDITIVYGGVTQPVITKTVKMRNSDKHDD